MFMGYSLDSSSTTYSKFTVFQNLMFSHIFLNLFLKIIFKLKNLKTNFRKHDYVVYVFLLLSKFYFLFNFVLENNNQIVLQNFKNKKLFFNYMIKQTLKVKKFKFDNICNCLNPTSFYFYFFYGFGLINFFIVFSLICITYLINKLFLSKCTQYDFLSKLVYLIIILNNLIMI